ncbi:MAG: BlaI/MecI/CopY family transcriptional regulator [Gammaproteobacteria bacterium]
MTTQNPKLSRREREILDILLELQEASAQEVRERLTDPPSNSAARALLSRLEKKGVISHIERDLRYVYIPTVPREEAHESALSRLVKVFYNGSLASAVTGLLQQSSDKLSDDELNKLEQAIHEARRKRK